MFKKQPIVPTDSVIFSESDENITLRANYLKRVTTGSVALVCFGSLSGLIALVGAIMPNAGLEQGEDDTFYIALFAGISFVYFLLAIRKWAHVTFVIATVVNILFLLTEVLGIVMALGEGVDNDAPVFLSIVTVQAVVTLLVIRGLVFVRRLRSLRFDITGAMEWKKAIQ